MHFSSFINLSSYLKLVFHLTISLGCFYESTFFYCKKIKQNVVKHSDEYCALSTRDVFVDGINTLKSVISTYQFCPLLPPSWVSFCIFRACPVVLPLSWHHIAWFLKLKRSRMTFHLLKKSRRGHLGWNFTFIRASFL